MKKIQTKFILPILLLQVIALASLGALGYSFSSSILRDTAEQQFKSTVNNVQSEITSTLNERLEKVRALLADPIFTKFTAAPYYKSDADVLILNFQRGNGLVLSDPSVGNLVNFPIGLLANEGNRSVSDNGIFPSVEYAGSDGMLRLHVYTGGSNDADFDSASEEKISRKNEKWFQEAISGKTYVSAPLNSQLYLREYDPIGISSNERKKEIQVVEIAIPHVIGEKVVGALLVTTTPDFIFRSLPKNETMGLLEVTDSNGAVIAKIGDETLDKEIKAPVIATEDEKPSIVQEGSLLSLLKPIEPAGWTVSMFARSSDVYGKVYALRNIIFVVMATSLLIMGLVIIIIIRTLARPILKLTSASDRIANGELGVVIERTTDDEIGTLTDSFNKMSVATKEMNEQLEKQNVRLERINHVRRELLHIISHELRTPLNGITGFYELMQDEVSSGKINDEKEFSECMDGLGRSIKRYQTLVERLTKASSVISREMRSDEEEADANCIIVDVINHSIAGTQKFTTDELLFTYPEEEQNVEVKIPSDAMRIVIDEALSNAVKFSPEGSRVEVSLSVKEKFAEIFIKDHGKGIPHEYVDDVIEPFFEIGDSTLHFSDRFKKGGGGLGLGLTLIGSVLKKYGGSVKIISAVESGTTLVISVPLIK